MELCYSRHSRNPNPTQLRKLLAFGRVDIDEAVHVPNAKPLHAVWGMQLPLRTESIHVSISHSSEWRKERKGEGGQTS